MTNIEHWKQLFHGLGKLRVEIHILIPILKTGTNMSPKTNIIYDTHPIKALEEQRLNVCYEYMYPRYRSSSFESLQMFDNESYIGDFGYTLH